MPVGVIGLITLALCVLALRKGSDLAVSIFVPSTLLGAAAAVNAPGAGSIQPAQLLLATLALSVVGDPGKLRRCTSALGFPAPGFWLACTCLYGVLAAAFIPRLLATAFAVNAIGSSGYEDTGGQVPFGPTTGNISQSIYFIGDLVCFLACLAVAGTPNGFRILVRALFLYCGFDLIFAFIDLVTYYTGTVGLLDFVRNAKYVIYVDDETTNSKRIIGSFTEASAFANATLGVLGFCAKAWLERLHPRLSLTLALTALALLLLSTSSTAYVGLAAGGAIFYASSAWAILRKWASGRDLVVSVIGPLLLVCCASGILLHPATAQVLGVFFDAALFSKSTSQSGLIRAMLNQQALQNVFDTAGFGTGLGGVRTSSFVLAVLANLGVLGGGAYAMFIVTALAATGRSTESGPIRQAQSAARAACIALLVAASISGALVDLGLPFFIFAALACARPRVEQDDRKRSMPKSSDRAWSAHGDGVVNGFAREKK